MNLRMLVIFLPSTDSNFMPICTATFCKAKSALTNQMLKDCYSYCASALNVEVISAIFLSQFLVVIQPSPSSDSLEEDDTLRLGLAGTTVHPQSSWTAYFYFVQLIYFTQFLAYQFSFYTYFFSQALLVFTIMCSFVSYQSSSSEYSVADSYPSSAISNRSSFSWIGGGYFLKDSPNPSFLQSMYVIAMSSISTCDSEAISPVFLANSLTSQSALSSQSIVSISKGNDSTNYLVLRSLSSPKTSSVVTILQVELRFLILLMEMKVFASRTAIDFLSDCIVEYLLIFGLKHIEITEYQEKKSFQKLNQKHQHSQTNQQVRCNLRICLLGRTNNKFRRFFIVFGQFFQKSLALITHFGCLQSDINQARRLSF